MKDYNIKLTYDKTFYRVYLQPNSLYFKLLLPFLPLSTSRIVFEDSWMYLDCFTTKEYAVNYIEGLTDREVDLKRNSIKIDGERLTIRKRCQRHNSLFYDAAVSSLIFTTFIGLLGLISSFGWIIPVQFMLSLFLGFRFSHIIPISTDDDSRLYTYLYRGRLLPLGYKVVLKSQPESNTESVIFIKNK